MGDDSDAELNNDRESPTKTRARFVNAPKGIPPGKPAALTGMAQVGISGLNKVQYCVYSQKDPWPADDPYWTKADWKDAAILPPPADWGGGLPGGKLPAITHQTDPANGARPSSGLWASRLPTGRHCSPVCLPAVTTCAAAPSTPTAARSPCRAFRCPGPA